ncbi:S-adenosyl-L-methionine-dependent methyltransferase [Spinellus fusiger]|nr:S-adenosyl-L-methionine-dependent methyltransferase [Spinellus fusiger]
MAEFWESRWATKNTGWDAGRASPALVKLIQDTENGWVPLKGRGLVPGCGAGYDVECLATKDRPMTGLDLSSTCIRQCQENHPHAKDNNYEFILGDFFTFDLPKEGYTFAYDYTFLAALDPSMRTAWAARYSEILPPGGILIALMYPLDVHVGGPPFTLSEEM